MASLLESVITDETRSESVAPLTIAVVAACPFPAPRGTPIRVLRLSEALAARGHRVHVVTYGDPGEVPASLAVHRIGLGTGPHQAMVPGPSYRKLTLLDPMLTTRVARLVRQLRVDVIHAHHYEGLLAGAVARLGLRTPLVYDAHTMLGSELPSYGLGLPRRVKRFVADRLDRTLPKWSNHVAAVTERIRNRLIASGTVSPDRVTVVPNGVEVDRFVPPPTPARGEGTRTLIFTGNLAPYQRIDLMLRAFRRIRDRRADVRLLVVAGSSLEDYEPLARELGVRNAIEVVPSDFAQVPGLLARADIALNPRIDCDGIPLKLLNYLASSRPVLSFEGAAPGLRHRDNAWLVADGDVDAFATGALDLLDDPALGDAIGRNGRRFVELNHTWDRSAAGAEAIFTRLVASAKL